MRKRNHREVAMVREDHFAPDFIGLGKKIQITFVIWSLQQNCNLFLHSTWTSVYAYVHTIWICTMAKSKTLCILSQKKFIKTFFYNRKLLYTTRILFLYSYILYSMYKSKVVKVCIISDFTFNIWLSQTIYRHNAFLDTCVYHKYIFQRKCTRLHCWTIYIILTAWHFSIHQHISWC